MLISSSMAACSASAATGSVTFQVPPALANVTVRSPRVRVILSASTNLARVLSRNPSGPASNGPARASGITATVTGALASSGTATAYRPAAGFLASTGPPILSTRSAGDSSPTFRVTTAAGSARPNFFSWAGFGSNAAIDTARSRPSRAASWSSVGWSAFSLAGFVSCQLRPVCSTASSVALPSVVSVRTMPVSAAGSNWNRVWSTNASRSRVRSAAVRSAITPTAGPSSTRTNRPPDGSVLPSRTVCVSGLPPAAVGFSVRDDRVGRFGQAVLRPVDARPVPGQPVDRQPRGRERHVRDRRRVDGERRPVGRPAAVVAATQGHVVGRLRPVDLNFHTRAGSSPSKFRSSQLRAGRSAASGRAAGMTNTAGRAGSSSRANRVAASAAVGLPTMIVRVTGVGLPGATGSAGGSVKVSVSRSSGLSNPYSAGSAAVRETYCLGGQRGGRGEQRLHLGDADGRVKGAGQLPPGVGPGHAGTTRSDRPDRGGSRRR